MKIIVVVHFAVDEMNMMIVIVILGEPIYISEMLRRPLLL